MGQMGYGYRPQNEQCPHRPGGGPHAGMNYGGVGRCIYCSSTFVFQSPDQSTEYRMSDEEHPPAPVEPKMVHTDPWREGAGLIDRLLDLRALPPAGVREMYRYMDSEEYEDGYKAGIDAALDALVPALKELVLQPTLNGMPGAYSKSTTDRIIGRVPLKRTSTGWE